ncbi:MAG: hypothetical protein KatS3mg031_2015 [Chitinophagales bacterium]|nr:MAG: hypothetical protein KatS3mg031_2015 [Chitinophagales bacterium]
MKPLVILPVLNEEAAIEGMLKKIRDCGLEVVVVDEHSSDASAAIASRMGAEVVQRDGTGKGQAIKKGLELATQRGHDYLLWIDCDGTYPAERLSEFTRFEQFDMIVGTRPMHSIEFKRRIANYLMTGFVNLLFGSSFKDVASGMRAVRVATFKNLITADSFDIEPQLSCIAAREGFSVKEIDIPYYARTGTSKIHILHFFLILARIFRERLTKSAHSGQKLQSNKAILQCKKTT